MPRPLWNGMISFGLVSIPVKMYNAVSRKSVSFNQIDKRSGSRIKLKKVSAFDGSDVPDEEIVKGYELGKDRYVIIDPAELDAFEAAQSRAIDIEEFVDLDQIDPVFYDSAYYLAPDKSTLKHYALLQRAMSEANKVGIARFVMRSKQYVAAVRAADGHLVISTMVYADEVVDPASIDEIADARDIEVSEKEMNLARQLIESLAGDFEPEKYHDAYREQVLDLIQRKASGEEEIELPAPAPTAAKVVDLMAALEASVREAKAARQRHPASNAPETVTLESTGDETGDGEAGASTAKPKAARAKKATAPAPKVAAARKKKSA